MGVIVLILTLIFLYIAAFGMTLGHKMFANRKLPSWIGGLVGLVASFIVGPVGIAGLYRLLDNHLPQKTDEHVRFKKVAQDALVFWIVLLFAFLLLFPYYWMVVTSIRPTEELIRLEDSLLWTKNPTFQNFQDLINDTPFKEWMQTSLTVSISTTVFSVVIGTLAAYALVRFQFRGARLLGLSMFITYLVPPILLFIPMMTITRSISIPQPDFNISFTEPSFSVSFENKQLYNSLWALIMVYPTFLVPFSTWFLMGFFRSIPPDMEECARVDGATYWQAFYKVTLPLARPGLVSAAIFSFTLSWGEYLYARSLILSKNLWTLPVGVPSELTSSDVFFWGLIMAAALLGSLPIVIIYSFFMKAFVSGMTAGAVKG